jgi:hypothetical protein
MPLSSRLSSLAHRLTTDPRGGVVPTCNKCGQVIASEDVNPANDVAYCRRCNLAHSLAQLVRGSGIDPTVDTNNPPVGAWCRDDGIDRTIGATHRSAGGAIGALLIGLFWNGIVSIFVLIALASSLRHLDIPLPEWFPAPDMSGSPMSVGMTIFLWIFLTPFIAIGLALAGAFLSYVAGRSEVRIRGGEGVVFSGVGPLGWRRRFDASAVKEVRVEDRHWRDSDGDRRQKTQIVIEPMSGKPIRFGSMLTEDRRRFVAAALRSTMAR